MFLYQGYETQTLFLQTPFPVQSAKEEDHHRKKRRIFQHGWLETSVSCQFLPIIKLSAWHLVPGTFLFNVFRLCFTVESDRVYIKNWNDVELENYFVKYKIVISTYIFGVFSVPFIPNLTKYKYNQSLLPPPPPLFRLVCSHMLKWTINPYRYSLQ